MFSILEFKCHFIGIHVSTGINICNILPRQFSYFEAFTKKKRKKEKEKSLTRKTKFCLIKQLGFGKRKCQTRAAALDRLVLIKLIFTIVCTLLIQFKNN